MICNSAVCFLLLLALRPCAARYGVPHPPDIASQYWRLANLPVELMAGTHDGIIPPVNVRRHYRAMQAAGMKVRGAHNAATAVVAGVCG